ncbi:collagen alpha-5(IV) chain-like [Tyto alba]|uniref:collagen alpha-5(IV) chain-like n=1 Tax=Tyto alba TaxID=56313 RepID=UPI001C672D74|nr:collagen alpha-5(IV) chain-like [Tyto alba]
MPRSYRDAWGLLRMPGGYGGCGGLLGMPGGIRGARGYRGCPGMPGCPGVPGMPGGTEVPGDTGDARRLPRMPGGTGVPGGYRGCPGVPGCPGIPGMPGGYRGCPRLPRMPRGTGDARGYRGCPGVPGCPGCGGALVPPRGLPPPAAAQGPARSGSGGSGGGRRSVGAAEQQLCSAAQRLQTGLARRPGAAAGAPRQDSAQHPSARFCSSSLANPANIFFLCCFPETHVFLYHPSQLLGRADAFRKSGSEQSLPLRPQEISPDLPAGTGWEFIATMQAKSLARISDARSHQGTEILASHAAYGNLSSCFGEPSKSPEDGWAGESVSLVRGAPGSAW